MNDNTYEIERLGSRHKSKDETKLQRVSKTFLINFSFVAMVSKIVLIIMKLLQLNYLGVPQH